MQRVDQAGAVVDRAGRGDERLAGDLPAEHPLAVLVGRDPAEHVDLDRLEVEQSDQVVERRVSGIHAGHIIAARSFTSATASVFATPLT